MEVLRNTFHNAGPLRFHATEHVESGHKELYEWWSRASTVFITRDFFQERNYRVIRSLKGSDDGAL
jgi:hypothetical protein